MRGEVLTLTISFFLSFWICFVVSVILAVGIVYFSRAVFRLVTFIRRFLP